MADPDCYGNSERDIEQVSIFFVAGKYYKFCIFFVIFV